MTREVALFYDGFEAQARDHPLGRLRSAARGQARDAYRRARGRQLHTGYYTAFTNLVRSLRARGVRVRVNDFAFARAHPERAVGLSGYASVLDRVRLPNPAVLGPGLVPPPGEIEPLMTARNLRVVTLPSEWPCEIWRPSLGEAAQPMPVAIDLDAWPDLSGGAKSIDVVVYDKIRWHREAREADVLRPFLALLERRGLSHVVLRYGHHPLSRFKAALAAGRSLAFLCEHETQGLAYQEAMASGVPVLAWDEGELIDPHQRRIAPDGLRVSSVPYFDARCGERFALVEMEPALDRFWGRLGAYEPRAYVAEALGARACAERYLALLRRAEFSP